VSRLDPEKVGLFLRQQRDELTRIWRMARASARPEVFPGLIDGLVGEFLDRAGRLAGEGAAPEAVWSGLSGVLRWPGKGAPDELAREWALLLEVIVAACEAVNASPAASDWFVAALAACEAGTRAQGAGGPRPPGVLTLHFFSAPAPPSERTAEDESPS